MVSKDDPILKQMLAIQEEHRSNVAFAKQNPELLDAPDFFIIQSWSKMLRELCVLLTGDKGNDAWVRRNPDGDYVICWRANAYGTGMIIPDPEM